MIKANDTNSPEVHKFFLHKHLKFQFHIFILAVLLMIMPVLERKLRVFYSELSFFESKKFQIPAIDFRIIL